MSWRTGPVLTVVFLLTSGSSLPAQAPNPNQATVAYLHSLSAPDGSYYPAAPKDGAVRRSSLRATTSAIRALKYFGDKPRNPEATARFVASCFDATVGGFGDAPGEKPTVPTTAVGIMLAVDLGIPVDRYRAGVVKYLSENAKTLEEIRIAAAAFESLQMKAPRADAWLLQIAQARRPDGTFGEGAGMARATGGTVAMVLRLGGEVESRDTVLKALRAGQQPDGGFGSTERPGSDLETSYRVMRAFVMLKERPAEPEKLRAFIARCRTADGGFSVAPGQPSSASGTYYAAIILRWLRDMPPA
jgi:prenyltransferase beta subunit